jgi:prepilin-type N-terminal cleavage/methylation domain-containing protein
MKQDLSLSTRKAWSRINRGFSLIEVILSSAVFALLVTAFVGTYLYGEEASSLAGNRARAGMLASEGLEAVRNIRDAGFSALVDGTYGLTTTGNQWNLSGSNDVTGMFTRQVTLSTIDTKRKSVTSVVAWQQNPQRTGSVSLTTELTNWQALGSGDWTVPSVSGSLNLSGNQDGNRIQVSGNYAYLTRANATNNFVVVDISSPDAPALLATLSVTGTPTNLFVSGNYAYVTTNDNTQELQIVNVSNPASPSVVGSYNAPGNADANGVFVVGTTAYVVQSNSASSLTFAKESTTMKSW